MKLAGHLCLIDTRILGNELFVNNAKLNELLTCIR